MSNSVIEKELTFIKDNGYKIAAKVFIPAADATFPTVIFSHGYNECYRALEHHGRGFAENGFVCVLFDFCGGGMNSWSDGKMTEMTVLTEADELKLVFDEVSKLDYVDSNNITLQGESMGGFVSTLVAKDLKDKISSLVLWYPAYVIPDDSTVRFLNNDNTCMGLSISPDFNRDSKDIDIYGIMKEYKGPVKLIHGTEDPIVALDYSKRAKETFENADLLIIEGAGHGFDEHDCKVARDASIEFITKYIR